MNTPAHTVKAFTVDLNDIRSRVLTLGGLVERQVGRSVQALEGPDLIAITEILADESLVNRLHVEADLLCNQVIARRQPIAGDLREVIASMHIINDLERVGDEAKKTAKRARRLDGSRLVIPMGEIREMADEAADMLRMALDAYSRMDTSVASELRTRDRRLDDMRNALTAKLLGEIGNAPENAAAALELIMVVKSLERVGDHAKNIAQYVVNVVNGVDGRHAQT